MLDPRSPGAGLVLLATVTTVYWVGNIAGSAAGETTAVDTNAVLPAPQTQVAPAASSDPVFGNQPVRSAPEISSISRYEEFERNAAIMDALAEVGIAILNNCQLTEYADLPPELCVAEEISSEIDGYQEQNIEIVAEQFDELLIVLNEKGLSDLSEKLTAVQELVDSAKAR
jgi:hypothetical protein